MKSKLLLITIYLTLSFSISANTENSGELYKKIQPNNDNRAQLFKKLQLTKQQRTKFVKIMKTQKIKRIASIKKNHKHTKLLLKEILTKKQMKIMEENRPEHPIKHNKKRRIHGDQK